MSFARIGKLKPFSTIGIAERLNVLRSLSSPLSGYIGGNPKAGYWVTRLTEEWRQAFNVKYAIPCNSATSGLLAACMAAGIGEDDEVWTTPLSMSATAAVAKVLGAYVKFIDIELVRYGINMNNFQGKPKAIIVANIFGHPAHLAAMRAWCDTNGVVMIEDNAQSPFATENGQYAGTIGHMGVFSLNVHKHIQCGEGGVIVTNNFNFGMRVQDAINHGELSNPNMTGLNLRMTEPVAAIACAQLKKAKKVIAGRVELALELNDMASIIPDLVLPKADVDCTHVYYMWCARALDGTGSRLVRKLYNAQIPVRLGYSPLLTKVFYSTDQCPEAQKANDSFVCFEICAYDPSKRQLKIMREAFKRAQ